VNDIEFTNDHFLFGTSGSSYSARVACAGYGKRCNLDIKWKRPFTLARKNKLNNYLAVKYHVSMNFPPDTIALHNFPGGYCGIVRIESGKYNLCYLTSAANLREAQSDIRRLETGILSKNPLLQRVFAEAEFITSPALTISQVSFDKKSQVWNHVLMTGDAAGMITPLCGNGMSMAMHAGKLAAEQIDRFLKGQISREGMERVYKRNWEAQFSKRMRTGRLLQRIIIHRRLNNTVIGVLKHFPRVVNWLIRQTHGQPF
jgi:flavin-dependent dehydrogenase